MPVLKSRGNGSSQFDMFCSREELNNRFWWGVGTGVLIAIAVSLVFIEFIPT